MIELKKLLAVMRPYRWRIALASIVSLLTILANIGLFGVSGYLISSAALHPANVLLLWVPIVGVRFFGISRAVFRYLERLFSHDVTFRILSDLRVYLFRKQALLGPLIWQTKQSARVLAQIIGDVEQVQYFYLRLFSPVLVAILTGIIGTYWFSLFDLRMAFAFVVIYLIAGSLVPCVSVITSRSSGKQMVLARSELYLKTANLFHSLSHWLLSGQAQKQTQSIQGAQQTFASAQDRANQIASVTNTVLFVLNRIALLMIFFYAVDALQLGIIRGVELPMLMLVSLACFEAISTLPTAFVQWSAIRQSAQRLFEDTSTTSEISIHEKRTYDTTYTVECKQLAKQYDPLNRHALESINLCIARNEHVAIIGESGAGKSTLIKLLMGDVQPSNGSIHFDETWDPNHSNLALVSQNVYLFHATVAENIRLGKPNATQNEMEIAAKRAQIHERILQLPQGYQTRIGELGSTLSGGERQRIGLARALLRDAKLYLFDEPLNGLDRETAEAFVQTVHRTLLDKSVLWITHRMEGIEQFNRILVMNHGKLIAQGDHRQLLHDSNYYNQLRDYDSGLLKPKTSLQTTH